MSPMEKAKLFISHSWEDKPLVEQLEKKLKSASVDFWIDRDNIRGGDQIPKRVSEALDWCNTVLLIWSQSAKESKWVDLEWNAAVSLHRKTIPCLLDGSKLPSILAGRAYIDFRNFNKGMEKLFQALNLKIPEGHKLNQTKSPENQSIDLQIELPLSLEEIQIGATKKITFSKYMLCNSCEGYGVEKTRNRLILNKKCTICNGTRRVLNEKTISVDIPAGVHDGNYLTIRGEGSVEYKGKKTGDLFLVIKETAHQYFKRNSDDILYELYIKNSLSVIKVEVPTLSGKKIVEIDSSMKSGSELRLKNYGIPHLNGYGAGDQIIRVHRKAA